MGSSRGAAGLAALVLAATVAATAACRTDPSVPGAGASAVSDPASARPSASASTGVADPAHAVPPPGPRTRRLWSSDILVFSREALTDQMVTRIKAVTGVEAVERLSLAQVTIENRAINIAVVDPATYRLFTPQPSADLLEIWTRVAGGEVAVSPMLGRRLASAEGYLRLGAAVDSPELHVGAYAPQVPHIDAVVNARWGDALGMVPGNALLVSTGVHAPGHASIRKPLERIAGRTASVQNLDVVARLGLDTSVQQTAFLTGSSIADVVGSFNYRVLGGGRIAPDPAWVAANIRTEPMPIIGPMTCHQALMPQLRAALEEIAARGLADKIHPDEYAGCYHPRFIAGTTTLSNHSFGLAIDINVPGNQRGTVGEIDRTVVSIFKKWGFAWGGDWTYTDPMHFEMNQLVDPR